MDDDLTPDSWNSLVLLKIWAEVNFSSLQIGSGSLVFPSVYNLVWRWVPLAEKAVLFGFVTGGLVFW